MTTASKSAKETAEQRERRRESLLKYGPIFASALRFSFDWPDDKSESALPKEDMEIQEVEYN